MIRHLWILDPGHGHTTAGKRSPVWDDGRQLLEYEFNRAIAARLVALCEAHDVLCVDVVGTIADVPLPVRVQRAHAAADASRFPAVYLSLHANAGGGTGWEVWTSRGQTRSDEIATVFARQAQAYLPDMVIRTSMEDGDPDKEAGFYVLRKTKMPAVLIEFAFMDNLLPDCEALMSERGRDAFAAMTFNAILEIEGRDVIAGSGECPGGPPPPGVLGHPEPATNHEGEGGCEDGKTCFEVDETTVNEEG